MSAARPRFWLVPFALLTAVLLVAPRMTDPAPARVWAALAALVAASTLLRGVATLRGPDRDRRALARLGVLLPPRAREEWRAEMASVLHHVGTGPARRREAVGYLLALPGTVVCCWRLHRSRP